MNIKIISGGQTGADRAALDFAIYHGIAHGGWCPRGRRALDGRLDDKYLLKETPSDGWVQRTAWNVHDSDATVIFTFEEKLSGGSKLTADCCKAEGRACLHITQFDDLTRLKMLIGCGSVGVLNVAGSRESKAPGIYNFVYSAMEAMFA